MAIKVVVAKASDKCASAAAANITHPISFEAMVNLMGSLRRADYLRVAIGHMTPSVNANFESRSYGTACITKYGRNYTECYDAVPLHSIASSNYYH